MYNTAILRLLQQLSSGVAALSINVSDTVATSESITVRSDENINVSDTITTSESKTLLIPTLFINKSDTVTTSESINVLPIGIYWDAVSNSGYKASFSTYNWSHTTTGVNRGLVVNVSLFLTGSVTSITYNSVNLQFIRQDTIGVYRNEIWVLYNPTVGTNTIAVTLNTSLTSIAGADSYTGVDTDMVEVNTGTTGSGISTPSLNVTTASDQAWVIDGLTTSNAAMSVAGGQTQRNNQTGALGTGAIGDKGPITPTGSTTMSWSAVGVTDSWALGAIALNPAGQSFTATISVSDTVGTSETVTMLAIDFINKSDTVATAETVDIIRNNARDINVSDSVSTSESVTVNAAGALNVNVSDTLATSESVTINETARLISISDTSNTSETVTLSFTSSINVSDTAATSESITLLSVGFVNKSDTVNTSESISLVSEANINKSDTVNTSESISKLVTNFVNVSDTALTSETITISESGLVLSLSDTVSTSELVGLIVISGKIVIVSDTVTVTEAIQIIGPIYSDSVDNMTPVFGPTASSSAGTDSDELITAVSGSTQVGADDSLETINPSAGTTLTGGNQDSV